MCMRVCACVCVQGGGGSLSGFFCFFHPSICAHSPLSKKKKETPFLPPVAADVGNLVFSVSWL